jgi:hypothetical protein
LMRTIHGLPRHAWDKHTEEGFMKRERCFL